jgi:hypothetical protein
MNVKQMSSMFNTAHKFSPVDPNYVPASNKLKGLVIATIILAIDM